MTRFPFPHVSPFGAPFSGSVLRRDLNRLFDEVFVPRVFTDDQRTDGQSPGETIQWSPAVEARESDTGYVFDFDLPGISPESVEVLAAEGWLTVRGDRPAPQGADREKALLSERPAGHFMRRFRLPKSANLQQVTASYALGVLTVRVAKMEPVQPMRVPVAVEVTPAALQTTREVTTDATSDTSLASGSAN